MSGACAEISADFRGLINGPARGPRGGNVPGNHRVLKMPGLELVGHPHNPLSNDSTSTCTAIMPVKTTTSPESSRLLTPLTESDLAHFKKLSEFYRTCAKRSKGLRRITVDLAGDVTQRARLTPPSEPAHRAIGLPHSYRSLQSDPHLRWRAHTRSSAECGL